MATLPHAFPWRHRVQLAQRRVARLAGLGRPGRSKPPWASRPHAQKPVFFDIVQSNHAARIRIWLGLKGLQDKVAVRMVTHADLKSKEFAMANPSKQVPALINEKGDCLCDSAVILGYLEDRYRGFGPELAMDTAEGRAFVHLLCHIHDFYIASPGFAQHGLSPAHGATHFAPHEQPWCRVERCMDKSERAAKLAEIWKQLTWLEEHIAGPFMAGTVITAADVTWYPTAVCMKFVLPAVYGWPEVFRETRHFPLLTAWFNELSKTRAFLECHRDIWDFWARKDEAWLESLRAELSDPGFKWAYP